MIAPTGIMILSSSSPVKETTDRLETFLKNKGAKIFVRIDQQAELENSGWHVPPLEFLLFGNPKKGGVLMSANPLIALDLPLKVIIWEDTQGKVQVAFNNGEYIEDRYSMQHDPGSPLHLESLISLAINS